MSPEEYKRQDIEILNEVRPYCFESDREEQWFKIGLQYGLDAADAEPLLRWISVDEDLPCNHEGLISSNPVGYRQETTFVLVFDITGSIVKSMMVNDSGKWEWVRWPALYWMPIPKLPKELVGEEIDECEHEVILY